MATHRKEWKAAAVVKDCLGPAAAQSAFSHAVVAMPVYDEASLFQFDHQCSSEEATRDLPFISIGSGQSLAAPFLAFLRRVFWPGKLPSLSEGILAALWTLEHAIATNTGGVAKTIQVMTLSKDKMSKKWLASELAEDEFQEHLQNIADAEQALANYRNSQTVETPAEVPTPDPTL